MFLRICHINHDFLGTNSQYLHDKVCRYWKETVKSNWYFTLVFVGAKSNIKKPSKKVTIFFGVENCFGVILILVELRYFRNSKNKKEENIAKSDLWIKHEIIGFRLCRLRVKLVYFWVRNFSNFYERIADVRFWNQSRGQKRSLQLVSLRQSWFFSAFRVKFYDWGR